MTTVGKTALSHVVTALLALTVLLVAMLAAPLAHAQLGRTVTNTATVTFDQGGELLTFNTNPATFTIEARRTPSTIEFFRYVAPGQGPITTRINGSDYNPGGEEIQYANGSSDPFEPVGVARTTGGRILDLSGDVTLAPAATYLSGELMIVRVQDLGQNGDPTRIETLVITIRSSSGDEIVLRLYESDPDTGEFYAYVPSSRDSTPSMDNVLTAPAQTTLTATYHDFFDETEVSIDTALVDPFGRIFDSLTGELINGVPVTIVDAATGQPASVFGIDGVSSYPSTIVTGATVTDASGLQYELEDGAFLFPLMAPGVYRLVIETPEDYSYPSAFEESAFAPLPNAPFEIIEASYGGTFTVLATGPLNFDIPLDPSGELVLIKSTTTTTASVGDTVGYTITVDNRDAVAASVRVRDTLPSGMRYVNGTARINGGPAGEVVVSADGSTINFAAGVLPSGESLRLTYAAQLTAGARPGEAVNTAVAVNGSGNPVSNRAESAIQVVEDLLRSRLTIIGRVAEAACDGDQDWAKELLDGEGVPGVRLYMETGNYVVTDEDGLYHFEGVRPGAHVVQIDEATLPAGYEPMICEDNSRYAGSSISKFVDAQGGMIWRANFYLRKTGDVSEAEALELFDDTTEYKSFDEAWLEGADSTPRWVYPDTDRTPSSRSVNIGIVHPRRYTVKLTMNGKPVPAINFSGRDTAETGPAEISRWRGVDIEAGENRFVAQILDEKGQKVTELSNSIWHITDIERARLVLDQSELVADGRTNPVVAVRLENAAGRPVHKGRVVQVDISEPYLLKRVDEFARASGVSTQTSDSGVQIGPDGVARIELEPTLKTGRVRVRVRLDTGREENIEVWLTPEKRDWILVGLAEGSIGLEKLDDSINDNTGTDKVKSGRIAFFAKGMVRGDWLMTMAVDTAKRRGQRDEELFDGYIDPNAYYTLYGDKTYQYSEAESRYPLFVKLEKDAVQLLFGDYDTDLNDTVLGQYSRRMSGAKGVYEGENVSVTGFAAETNQGFRKDEIAADGTSGIYTLSGRQIVRNSEQLILETRDRVRPDQILARRSFVRWVDYEIDYFTGEVIFRHPVDATDAGFNPNVIVADYEVAGDVERNVTMGGRAAVHTADRRLELGATYVREDGSNIEADATGDVAAVDFTARFTEQTELRAEVATSSRDAGTGTESAGAYLLEVEHQGEALTVTGYLQEEEAGFGLGQQASSTQSIRRVGADASLKLSGEVEAAAGARNERFIEGRAYREENLDDDASRDVVEAAVRQDNAVYGGSLGLRSVREEYPVDGEVRQSVLLTASARRTFAEQGLTVSASHEQPIGSEGDEATLFPQRTQIAVDKVINDHVSINARHEANNGANASGNNTALGVTVRPWSGGQVLAATDLMTQDSVQRLGATLGVDQTFQINDAWSASLGATRRARIDGGDDTRDVTPDAAVSPFEDAPRSNLVGDDFYTSLYAGAGYREEKAAASARVEYRDGASSERWSGVIGSARESTEALSYGVAARVQTDDRKDGPNRATADVRIGSAYRPRGEGLVVFNRLDARYEKVEGELETRKIVNNLGANMMVTDRTQAAVNYGIKYQESRVADLKTSGITQLIGAEIRHDLTRKVDIGFAGSALVDHTTNTADYSFGPSIGFTPAKNVWMSVGYNISGFEDKDFEAAEYTREGVYLKLRVKFDQHTAEGLLKRISPKRD